MDQSTAVAPGVDDPAVPSPFLTEPGGLAGQDSPWGQDWPAGPTASPSGPVGGATSTTAARPLWVILGSAVVAVVVAALVVAGLLASSAWRDRRQARAADAAAAATRIEVRKTDHRLDEVQAELREVHARSGAAETALEAANRSLAALRFELAGTQDHQFDQGVSIGAVQTCLGGVQSALNDIALGFPGQATAALHKVAGSCATAGASEG